MRGENSDTDQPGEILIFYSEQSWTLDWENWEAGLKIWIQMFVSCTTLIWVS